MLTWLIAELKQCKGGATSLEAVKGLSSDPMAGPPGPPVELDDWSTDAGSESLPVTYHQGAQRFRQAASGSRQREDQVLVNASGDHGISAGLLEGAWESLLETLGTYEGNARLLEICKRADEDWEEAVNTLTRMLEACAASLYSDARVTFAIMKTASGRGSKSTAP